MNPAPRLSIERLVDPGALDTLVDDARRGLFGAPKTLPPKHLYDEEGGRLFRLICELPEYYPTRTEIALLEVAAHGLLGAIRPTSLVELGSGDGHKARILLDALAALGGLATYLPIDLDEAGLRSGARALCERYPRLAVRGLIADFERPPAGLPRGPGTLLAFLGGTIGNLEPGPAAALLSRWARAAGPGASLLLGFDRVKDPWRIAAAYDDARGVTARFNLNLLRVLNRRLGASFDPADFRHLAFYDRRAAQVEMHLVARRPLAVPVPALDRVARFAAGESLRTEISRKFTLGSMREAVESAGWTVRQVVSPPSGDFSLLWAVAEPAARGALAPSPVFP